MVEFGEALQAVAFSRKAEARDDGAWSSLRQIAWSSVLARVTTAKNTVVRRAERCADGTAPRLKSGADWLWSLSPLTLPHGLVRVILAEQLYRAVSLLNNHPYHRA